MSAPVNGWRSFGSRRAKECWINPWKSGGAKLSIFRVAGRRWCQQADQRSAARAGERLELGGIGGCSKRDRDREHDQKDYDRAIGPDVLRQDLPGPRQFLRDGLASVRVGGGRRSGRGCEKSQQAAPEGARDSPEFVRDLFAPTDGDDHADTGQHDDQGKSDGADRDAIGASVTRVTLHRRPEVHYSPGPSSSGY